MSMSTKWKLNDKRLHFMQNKKLRQQHMVLLLQGRVHASVGLEAVDDPAAVEFLALARHGQDVLPASGTIGVHGALQVVVGLQDLIRKSSRRLGVQGYLQCWGGLKVSQEKRKEGIS